MKFGLFQRRWRSLVLLAKYAGGHSRSPGKFLQLLLVLLAALILASPALAVSDRTPAAPCSSDDGPSYPPYAEAPNARIWHEDEIALDWIPADCIGWAAEHFTILTSIAGYFRFDGSVDDLLARFGAVSTWRGITYWSVTDGRWDTLITDAVALDAFSHKQRRTDFGLAELKSLENLYFRQIDNRSSRPVIYRMRVITVESDRLVVTIGNVSAVSLYIFTLFDPGDLESTYIFEKISPTNWGFYSLSGVRERAAVIGNHEASYLSRTAAIYRHLIGIPGNTRIPGVDPPP